MHCIALHTTTDKYISINIFEQLVNILNMLTFPARMSFFKTFSTSNSSSAILEISIFFNFFAIETKLFVVICRYCALLELSSTVFNRACNSGFALYKRSYVLISDVRWRFNNGQTDKNYQSLAALSSNSFGELNIFRHFSTFLNKICFVKIVCCIDFLNWIELNREYRFLDKSG